MAFKFSNLSPIPLIVAVAMFMELLDGTIIVTALPQMAQSFHTTPTSLSLGITAYMLTVACCVPISGWMADRFGSRTVFCSAVAVFILASVLCALSVGEVSFVLARVLQGAAAGLMSPVGRLIVV
ncbi:MAG: MFS transporter, partial [Alphaproteobacteria bacterium]